LHGTASLLSGQVQLLGQDPRDRDAQLAEWPPFGDGLDECVLDRIERRPGHLLDVGHRRDGVERALPDAIERMERERIQQALEACRYNKTKAAAHLGITFRALRYKLKKLGIE